MAITLQRIPDGEDVWGRMRTRFVDAILDTSYPTGGYIVNASDVGMKVVYSVDLAAQNTGAEAWAYTFNINASVGTATAIGQPALNFAVKLFTFTGGVQTQVTAATNVSTATIRLCITGR